MTTPTLTRFARLASIPSFFHRLEDDRAKRYAELAAWRPASRDKPRGGFAPPFAPPLDRDNFDRRLELALAMTRDHPDDAAYGVFELDARTAIGDLPGLEAAVERWRPKFAGAPPSLQLAFRKADHSARALRLAAEDRNLAPYLSELAGDSGGAVAGGLSLAERLRRAPEIWKYAGFAQRCLPLSSSPDGSLLGIQTDARLKHVLGLFLLLRGQRRQALDLSFTSYRTGQLMSQGDDTLIHILIGIAIRDIALRPMEIGLLDGCETLQELADAWTQMGQDLPQKIVCFDSE